MNDENLPIINGNHDPEIDGLTTQKVPCGAAVHMSAEVMEHGILLIHDDLPLIQLFFNLDKKTKKLEHHFELVKPKTKLIKDYVIDLKRPVPKKIIQPEHKIVV